MKLISIKNALAAGALALGMLSASAVPSHAGDARLGIHVGGPGFYFSFGDDRRGYGRGFGPRRDFRRGNRCRPGKALRKAKRRGLRRARIVRVNRRGTVIAGRRWGERVVVGFGRQRSCPVRFVRHR